MQFRHQWIGRPTLWAICLLWACAGSGDQEKVTSAPVQPPAVFGPAQHYTYRIIQTYPHDPTAYTQGLFWEDGLLYEGTGGGRQLSRGRGVLSALSKWELDSGRVLQRVELPDQFFGEGITVLGDRVIQLTWTSRVGFVYDKENFALLGRFHYPTQGWGLTHDDQRLIMSDGTPMLYFLDPETFAPLGQIQVQHEGRPVSRLNELEYIEGEVYANIYQTDFIARIDPGSGRVVGWIDLGGLLTPAERQRADVLNGIAYDPEGKRLFVTGKWWPKFFEIELIPQ
ncbi:MAG: glutaminyl-peptide cyclotransferase [Candidatus Latescibacteria bacterium]|nr:glutaminyl-peptide cyclotransferase [Candidatus Latescibacterota bacterium]